MIIDSLQEKAGQTKVCRKCGQEKSLEDFSYAKHGKHQTRSQCRVCDSDYYKTLDKKAIKARNQKSREKLLALDPDARRWEAIKAKYKLTKEQWLARWEEQGRKCACCGRSPKENEVFDTEHCHGTKEIRGICCAKCNMMIGYLGDTSEEIEASVFMVLTYVKKN